MTCMKARKTDCYKLSCWGSLTRFHHKCDEKFCVVMSIEYKYVLLATYTSNQALGMRTSQNDPAQLSWLLVRLSPQKLKHLRVSTDYKDHRTLHSGKKRRSLPTSGHGNQVLYDIKGACRNPLSTFTRRRVSIMKCVRRSCRFRMRSWTHHGSSTCQRISKRCERKDWCLRWVWNVIVDLVTEIVTEPTEYELS